MEAIYLYIMDINLSEGTTGVDRYIEKLIEGLKHHPYIHVYRIQFLLNKSLILYREEQKEYYTQLILPLPQNYMEIISKEFWMRKYSEYAFHIMKKYFPQKENCILHLQTLNLIDMALLIKQYVNCTIITHLHCIPWKNYYNLNIKWFNSLYKIIYSGSGNIMNRTFFLSNRSELNSYVQTDHIICVTQSEVNFLTDIMGIPKSKISIVHNGINDYTNGYKRHFKSRSDSQFQCLFVANLSKSKGLEFILQALRILKKKGYDITLKIAGYTTQATTHTIQSEYNDLNIFFLGNQSFEQLIELYKDSDIGLIASLQEQWSFAAVEMAMFGLPIITTTADGLDEIFTDNVNALKVPLSFSSIFGLRIDPEMIATKIELLIENYELRKKLSTNARMLYKKKLTLDLMTEQTIKVYKQFNKLHI